MFVRLGEDCVVSEVTRIQKEGGVCMYLIRAFVCAWKKKLLGTSVNLFIKQAFHPKTGFLVCLCGAAGLLRSCGKKRDGCECRNGYITLHWNGVKFSIYTSLSF